MSEKVRARVLPTVQGDWTWFCKWWRVHGHEGSYEPTQHEAMTAAANHIREHHRGEKS